MSRKPVSFRLSEELKELVEERAAAEGTCFSAKVREYCRRGVDTERKNEVLITDE